MAIPNEIVRLDDGGGDGRLSLVLANEERVTCEAPPIIEGYDPPEGWGWCYIDEVMLDLSDRMTPHNGRIPRYY
jgi:hypothetical protein